LGYLIRVYILLFNSLLICHYRILIFLRVSAWICFILILHIYILDIIFIFLLIKIWLDLKIPNTLNFIISILIRFIKKYFIFILIIRCLFFNIIFFRIYLLRLKRIIKVFFEQTAFILISHNCIYPVIESASITNISIKGFPLYILNKCFIQYIWSFIQV
jgi:hypothetical protein